MISSAKSTKAAAVEVTMDYTEDSMLTFEAREGGRAMFLDHPERLWSTELHIRWCWSGWWATTTNSRVGSGEPALMLRGKRLPTPPLPQMTALSLSVFKEGTRSNKL